MAISTGGTPATLLSPLHFLVLPFPNSGHLLPTLAFAQTLAAQGCSITIVLPEPSHRAFIPSAALSQHHHSTQLIHFATLPGDFPPAEEWEGMMLAITRQQGFLQRLIESSKTTHTPISCLIGDLLFPWLQDVANECGIPRAVLWTCSGAVFCIGCLVKAAGGIYPGAPHLQDLQGKLQNMYSASSLLDFFNPEDPASKKQLTSIFERVDEASHNLINDFEALEAPLLHLLPPNVRFIGPCLPPLAALSPSSSTPLSFDGTARLGNLVQEDMACLSWLDRQEDSSVLFISFGSVASLAPPQLVEMALGVEASTHKYLWVARGNTSHGTFPEGFLERTKERGMVVSWAPQLQVLNHRAVGGFLTHCGWNSTIESMYMGVPMLCFPLMIDQQINEETIMRGDAVRNGVGLGFEERRRAGVKSGYVVSRGEVEKEVRALMGDDREVGGRLRENAQQLMRQAKDAVDHQSGSSRAALLSFLDDIRRRLSGSYL